jgi:hypothetical protein
LIYALRAMRHNLTFTVVVVLTLAVDIGANTTVFSVINSVLLKPLPIRGQTSWWRCGSARLALRV